MGSPLRAISRISLYMLWTLLLIPVQAFVLVFNRRLSIRLPVVYHRACARIFGFDIVVRGEMTPSRPALFVCNHTSYVDITVLASVIPGSFVAKAEIAGWPFFGMLAKLQRTVFIDRRGPRAVEHRDDMIKRLAASTGSSVDCCAKANSARAYGVVSRRRIRRVDCLLFCSTRNKPTTLLSKSL